jgi:hypothetical protein
MKIKTNQKILFIYFIIIIIFSFYVCETNTQYRSIPTNVEHRDFIVDSLVNVNSDKVLFLNFWSGMSYRQFSDVLEYENRKKRLINNKFEIIFPYGSDLIYTEGQIYFGKSTEKIELEITYDYNSITLHRSDRERGKLSNYKKKDEKADYYEQACKYSALVKHLINAFDEKYEKVEDDAIIVGKTYTIGASGGNNIISGTIGGPKESSIFWINKNRTDPLVIHLTAKLGCYYYSSSKNPSLEGFIVEGRHSKEIDFSELEAIEQLKLKENIDLMYFDLSITYKLYSSYKKEYQENEKRKKERYSKQKEIIEKQDKIIQDNKDLL